MLVFVASAALLAGLVLMALRLNLLRRIKPSISLSLIMLGYIASLFTQVGVEAAGRYGYALILGFIGLVFVHHFYPILLSPLRRVLLRMRFPTIIDFMVYRYRGSHTGYILFAVYLLALLPMGMAQLLGLFNLLAGYLALPDRQLWIILLVISLLFFVLLRVISVRTDISTSNLVSLVAGGLICCIPPLALAASWQTFGNWESMNHWLVSSGQQQTVLRFNHSFELFVMALSASLLLPGLLPLHLSRHFTGKNQRSVSWIVPGMVMILSLSLFLLMWSGIYARPDAMFQNLLPAMAELLVLKIVAICIVLAAAITMLWLILSTLAKVWMNIHLLPRTALNSKVDTLRWYRRCFWLFIFVGLLLLFPITAQLAGRNLTDLYLVAMGGMAQLLPALLGAAYISFIHRRGVLMGLLVGTSSWFFTLFIPLFNGDWRMLPLPFGHSVDLGPSLWGFWALESLGLNVAVTIVVSLFQNQSEEEKYFAARCNVDDLQLPLRFDMPYNSLAEFDAPIRRELGETADIVLAEAQEILRMDPNDRRPVSLRQFRDELAATMFSRCGTRVTTQVLENIGLLQQCTPLLPTDFQRMEERLTHYSDKMTGITAEINRLRLHHRDLLQKLPIGVCLIEASGEIGIWNNALTRMTKTSSDVMIGNRLASLPEPWAALLSRWWLNFNESSIKHQLLTPGCRTWLNIYRTEVGEEGEVLLLIEDATESVLLTQNHAHNERLASIGRLAAGVAHEVGNPLTGITCLAQDLQLDSDDETQQTAQLILQQTKRINLIVQSLLTYSSNNHTAAELEPLNLQQVADEAIAMLGLDQHGTPVQFCNDLPQQVTVLAHSQKMLQVFINLLRNARDASPEQGKIRVHLLSERPDGMLRIAITDQGVGIAVEFMSEMMEPFVTSKEAGKGTGLGLWICHNIIEGFNGSLEFVSPPPGEQRGTQVIVSLHRTPHDKN